MPKLTEHLLDTLPADEPGWADVRLRLEAGQNLEQSLMGLTLPARTSSLIRKEVGDHVAAIDGKHRDDVLMGRNRWVGEPLLNALGQRLPPANPRLPIVTSNYDMLIEYSCAKSGLRYTSGHVGGMIRTWNWQQAQADLTRLTSAGQTGKSAHAREPLPRVELYKVHGSINLFRHPKTSYPLECDVWAEQPPHEFERVVATPGDKFESYASNIEVAARALEAEAKAMAFLMIVLLRQRCVPGCGRRGNLAARLWQRREQRCPTAPWRSAWHGCNRPWRLGGNGGGTARLSPRDCGGWLCPWPSRTA